MCPAAALPCSKHVIKLSTYLANRLATAFSLSPTYLLNTSGPLIARKFKPEADAAARASSVLLQPGGPYSRTPAYCQQNEEG